MYKDPKVVPLNHYGFNLFNYDGQLTTTPDLVDGLLRQDWTMESTEYCVNNNTDSYLLAQTMSVHASLHNPQMRALWSYGSGHMALSILLIFTEAPEMTLKCDGDSCIRSKWAGMP